MINLKDTSEVILDDSALDDVDHSPVFPTLKTGGNLALTILATAAVLFLLNWAQSLVISLLLGVVFAYTLNPFVVWLEWIKVPRVIGAAIVIVTVVSALAFGAYSLRGQLQTIITQLPAAMNKLTTGLTSFQNTKNSNMQKIQNAASDMEKATSPATNKSLNSEESATHVVIDPPAFKINNFLWAGSRGMLGIAGQAAMVIFLVFFLLLAGGTFKRKMVRITGPTLSRRKITVHILNDINLSIQRYMLMLLLTNILVGLLCWLVFHLLGLENAGAWAVVAGLLHIVPYFGPGVTAGAVGMAAYLQFASFPMAFLVAGAIVVIATVVGVIITTWMTGKIARMNTAAVFISLLFWSWLWGVWGMLLSMPIIMLVKAISQHVEQMETVSELLGE
jgi:predicted PurR-regulated permease PerM